MMDRTSLRPWVRLRAVPGLGDAAICRLARSFGSAEAVLEASPQELMGVGSLPASLAEAILTRPQGEAARAIDAELDAIERLRLTVLPYGYADYPTRLRSIPDPPPLLYVRGELRPDDTVAVAVVGSRRATAAAKIVTEELSRDLAACGVTIVSGLARGVDAAAHRGALAGGGRTIAVLGCGLARTYPPEHESLQKQIEAHGAVLSEFPVQAPPHAYHFPRRNRIISGLSVGVLVTEAGGDSGSLITARLALEQGRDVFAVPGSIRSEQSRGSNGLLKQGAKPVDCAADVLEDCLPQLEAPWRDRIAARMRAANMPKPGGALHDDPLVQALSGDPTHIDDVIATTGLPAAEVAGRLLAMELAGLVRQLPGQMFIRV
jgi:DNA processing protein